MILLWLLMACFLALLWQLRDVGIQGIISVLLTTSGAVLVFGLPAYYLRHNGGFFLAVLLMWIGDMLYDLLLVLIIPLAVWFHVPTLAEILPRPDSPLTSTRFRAVAYVFGLNWVIALVVCSMFAGAFWVERWVKKMIGKRVTDPNPHL